MNPREVQHRLVEDDQWIRDDVSAEGSSDTRSELEPLLLAKGGSSRDSSRPQDRRLTRRTQQ
jgi:hypothetical protein